MGQKKKSNTSKTKVHQVSGMFFYQMKGKWSLLFVFVAAPAATTPAALPVQSDKESNKSVKKEHSKTHKDKTDTKDRSEEENGKTVKKENDKSVKEDNDKSERKENDKSEMKKEDRTTKKSHKHHD